MYIETVAVLEGVHRRFLGGGVTMAILILRQKLRRGLYISVSIKTILKPIRATKNNFINILSHFFIKSLRMAKKCLKFDVINLSVIRI